MLNFLPVHRPAMGISFHGMSIRVVKMRRRWFRYPIVQEARERRLPPELFKPSRVSPNVSDQENLEKEVQALVGIVRDPAVAVSLPDACAFMGLFTFDTLPRQKGEQEKLVRWRFETEKQVSVPDARLSYRVYGGRTHGSQPKLSPTYVLAILIKQNILLEYQQVLEATGLLPVSVGIASLQLFDLCRPLMKMNEEVLFAYQDGETLTFIAVRHGVPVFHRTMTVRRPSDIQRELIGTIQYYDDQYVLREGDDRGKETPLYFVSGESIRPTEMEESWLSHSGTKPWGGLGRRIGLVVIGVDALPVVNKTNNLSIAGLPALACGLAA